MKLEKMYDDHSFCITVGICCRDNDQITTTKFGFLTILQPFFSKFGCCFGGVKVDKQKEDFLDPFASIFVS